MAVAAVPALIPSGCGGVLTVLYSCTRCRVAVVYLLGQAEAREGSDVIGRLTNGLAVLPDSVPRLQRKISPPPPPPPLPHPTQPRHVERHGGREGESSQAKILFSRIYVPFAGTSAGWWRSQRPKPVANIAEVFGAISLLRTTPTRCAPMFVTWLVTCARVYRRLALRRRVVRTRHGPGQRSSWALQRVCVVHAPLRIDT
ncbi:hypothetical protein C0Q70_18526 [Pomacea canaliculata]|uniref:Uncharacterized protein n=1 Tax=Pomacea canaliculata TaxID=400727 RepID=A0A2T7NGW0_POMCA|nr:hypothetical protein C0Q70_18526 [Pomacea canaliculata]